MNDDIKILREALAKYAEFVEVDDGDPLEVPYRLYQQANTAYRQACDPDRIRRLLDDAERYQWLRENADSGVKIEIGNCGLEEGRVTLNDSIDQARKA